MTQDVVFKKSVDFNSLFCQSWYNVCTIVAIPDENDTHDRTTKPNSSQQHVCKWP